MTYLLRYYNGNYFINTSNKEYPDYFGYYTTLGKSVYDELTHRKLWLENSKEIKLNDEQSLKLLTYLDETEVIFWLHKPYPPYSLDKGGGEVITKSVINKFKIK